MRKVLYREPLINGGYSEMDNEGCFHEFEKVNDIACAIIERKDETIALIYADMVKFVDSHEYIENKKRWISVEESLPMKCEGKCDYSITVNLKTLRGYSYVGCYSYTTKRWVINGVSGDIEDIITEWKEIDE